MGMYSPLYSRSNYYKYYSCLVAVVHSLSVGKYSRPELLLDDNFASLMRHEAYVYRGVGRGGYMYTRIPVCGKGRMHVYGIGVREGDGICILQCVGRGGYMYIGVWNGMVFLNCMVYMHGKGRV